MVWNFFLQRTIVLRPHQLYALFDSSNNALLHLFFYYYYYYFAVHGGKQCLPCVVFSPIAL